MTTNIQCPPGTKKVGMECIPLQGEPSGHSQRQYYKQYLQDLPQYQASGQGAYTGMGTDAFHPMYGRSRSNSALSTPLISEYPGPTSAGRLGSADSLSPFKISGAAAGQSGYDPGSLAHGYRVRETPKRIDTPFSMGDPYAQGGSLWNVGRMMGDRSDPYEGVDPTLLYDLRSRAAGGALVPPGYTAGPGRTTPSEGTMSMPDLLKAANISEGSPLGRFYGGGISAGAPGGGGGLVGGIGSGAPSRRGTPSRGGKGTGGAKKSGGATKGSSSGLVGGIRKGAGTTS